MALFPDKIVFKNASSNIEASLASLAPGLEEGLVPGELFMFREANGFRLFSLDSAGEVVEIIAKIQNENKGSLTVSNYGEGPSSFVLNDGAILTSNIADSGVTSIKLATALSIGKGGTGQTTTSDAINALLPSQTGNANKILCTTGTSLVWETKKSVLNDYEDVDTATSAPLANQTLAWNDAVSAWEPVDDLSVTSAPASASDTGRAGQISFDNDYLYLCVNTNQWKRATFEVWNFAQILPALLSSSAAIYTPEDVGPLVPQYVGGGTYIGSRTPSVPWPAGHRPGDIGLLIVSIDSGFSVGTPNIVAQGWTLIVSSVNSNTGIGLYYKYAATSNEPNLAWNTGNYNTGSQIIVFRNITAVSPVDATNNAYLANNPSTQVQPLSVTTTAYHDLVLFFQRMGGTCGVTGGCQVASSTTLYSPFYFDDELGNGQPTGDAAGMIQAHASRKFEPGLADSILTYNSPNYSYFTNIYRITAALKRRALNKPDVEVGAKNVDCTPVAPRAGYVDPSWQSVSLLMSMDGANGSTTFTDESVNNHTITTYGTAQISTAQSQFGGSSGFFSGTVNDYVALPNNTTTSAPTIISNWWTGSYTLECWMRSSAFPTGTTPIMFRIQNGISGSQYWGFGPAVSGTLRFVYTLSGGTFMGQSVISSTNAVTVNTWQHIAMTYDITTTTIRLFVNGTLVGSRVGLGGTPVTAGPLFIGRSSGYIDEIRITKNVARYTSNFTPSTIAFPSE